MQYAIQFNYHCLMQLVLFWCVAINYWLSELSYGVNYMQKPLWNVSPFQDWESLQAAC
jgi:hypothetical protein